jgi:hypothetical protein
MKALAGLLCLAALAAALTPGRAGANYTVVECVAGVVGAPDAVAATNGTPKIFHENECVGGRRPGWGLSLEANGQSNSGEWRTWVFTAPPSTRFASASASVHQDPGYGYGALYSGDGGSQGMNNEWSTVAVADTSFFAVGLQCFPASCQSPGGAGDRNLNPGYAFVTNFRADVADQSPPVLQADGSILEGRTVSGQQHLVLRASDGGGGVRSFSVAVNGVESLRRDLCPPDPRTGAWSSLQPCALDEQVDLSLDTEGDPGWVNGPNEVEICAYDVAGNSSGCITRTVEVDNTCPASGGQAGHDLTSGIDSQGRVQAVARTRSSEAPVVRGVLRTGAGTPVEGATVCVYETVPLVDGSRELAAIATTQQSGRFATNLEPGPSREIQVVYRFNDRFLSRSLRLESAVVPQFRIAEKALRAGSAAHFSGSLPGPAAGSRVVALQARAGKKWRTFKQLRTDVHGRFRGKYPFRQTVGRVVYTFRALVKRQGEYPYEPGFSRKRNLIVRG